MAYDYDTDDNELEDYQKDEYGNDPCAEYWFKEEDPKALSGLLDGKVKTYQDYVRISTFYAWCRKSWLFYYKMAFQGEGEYCNVGVQAMGDEGELVGAQVNHMRNFIQHRVNLVTKDRPALICRARNTDTESQIQTEFGQGLVEHYMRDKRVEEHLALCVEHAMVFAEGFVVMTWDPLAGEITDADEETGELKHEGDLRFDNPVGWNVVRDLGVRDWDKHDWIGIRRPMNKWNLCANYPEYAQAIQSAERWTDVPLDEGSRPFDEDRYFIETDQVEAYEWWHRTTPALPLGRHVSICGGAVLQDDAWDYDRIPVERLTAADMSLTPYAYTPAFDLIPIQELINNAISTIATNQNAHGVQSLWMQSGGTLRISEVLGGMNLVQSENKPEALQLTETAAETFTFLNDLVRHAEQIAGIDQVTRGYTDANVRSGAFAALLQSQSVQFSSTLMRNYHQLMERVGSGIIKLIRQFATAGRVITIVGKHQLPYTHKFTGEDLGAIERVTVETTNPMFNTYAGKLEWAQTVAGTGLVKNQEELLNVFRTGNADTMLEADKAQLNLVREENEALMSGREVPDATPEEHQILHIKEHMSLLGSLEVKGNPEIYSAVLAHNMGHMTLLLSDPNAQMLQTLLGYQTPFPPGAAPDGSGGPVGPGGPQGPSAPEQVTGPQPQNPELDGRSVAQMPSPSTP